MKRRGFLIKVGIISYLIPVTLFSSSLTTRKNNFKIIYNDTALRSKFFFFLKTVFNLFPEKKLHELIQKVVNEKKDEKSIYNTVQKNLSQLSPILSVFQYELPALIKQKKEMQSQTLELLRERSRYDGYLEIGSSIRYLDYLEEKVDIVGKMYYMDTHEMDYSIVNMIDRGQIMKGASFISLNNYQKDCFNKIEEESLDLVTVYIGLHHCPIKYRSIFIQELSNRIRIGGKLILRDHDCYDEKQTSIVSLAHDVFNMGTHETWEYNKNELRNFYSLKYIQNSIKNLGFKLDSKILYQEKDPTKNALMLFTKVK